MKTTAIILCAGKGERAGFGKNKLFVKYDNLTVFEHTVSKFVRADVSEIIAAVSEADLSEAKRLAENVPNIKFAIGGDTRTQSVKNSLEAATGDIVLIHDGARMFVTDKIISDCLESVKNYGSGICALPATDTLVFSDGRTIESTPDRSRLYCVQTPQGFLLKEIKEAYSQVRGESYTDDSAVYAKFIRPPRLFTGDRRNIKLTYSTDFSFADYRTGFGVDTHAFGAERDYVTLCGVKIPSDSGLVAHSDGDVAAHAITDALLSAAGLRDIGYYFPDSDDKYLGADSILLLKTALSMIKDEGYRVKNVSVAIQAQKPRLSGYIAAMKSSLASALETGESEIGISAGTTEGLGYVGEGKGITVTAAVLIVRR